MSSKQADAVSSFANVIESVPKWRDQLSSLAIYTTQKHESYRAEYLKLVQRARPRRAKSRSITSIRSDDDPDITMTSPKSPSTAQFPTVNHVDFSPWEAGNRYIYAQASKKRRTGTSFRSGASGPVKFRSKQMVVIYYDSYAQERFEGLVKDIGGCRNVLRKGKMAYTASKGLQLPPIRRPADASISSSPSSIKSAFIPRHSPQLTASKPSPTAVESTLPPGETAFMIVDKDLETCQNLCETAAHQFLRDGDCKSELNTVLCTLTSILEQAKSAFDAFKAEDEVEKKKERSNSLSDSIHTTSGSTLVEKLSRDQLSLKRKSGIISESNPTSIPKERPVLGATVSAPPLTTEIEVDDDSDASSVEIDITQFRAGRSGGIRA